MTATYGLYLRDADRARVLEIDRYDKLDLVLRFNDVGAFALDVPAGCPAARALTRSSGLIVERDGAVLFSGAIRPTSRVWGAEKSMLTLAGYSDTVLLRDEWAAPVTAGPPYTAADHHVVTGVASSVMRTYVNENVGPGAVAARQRAGLTLGADPLIGATITGQARFDNLLELLQSLALAGGGVGFEVVQVGGSLAFRVYAPVDRTATAIFSPLLGTLAAFEYADDPPEANYVVVGGGGEGTARVFYEQGDAASIADWGRVARFRDRRDTADLAVLAQTATEELAGAAGRATLRITPIDTTGLAFGRDYGLGDQVSVVVTEDVGTTDPILVPLATVRDVVREVRITLTPEHGEVVLPTIGGSAGVASGAIAAMYQQYRELGGRVADLERRR